jgi:hypothetical protein
MLKPGLFLGAHNLNMLVEFQETLSSVLQEWPNLNSTLSTPTIWNPCRALGYAV